MIFLKRRRLYFWLIKAYLKKWRKTIALSFLFGLIVFFILKFGVNYFIPLIPFTQQETVGLVGTYSSDNLPQSILGMVSRGLTSVGPDQIVHPDIAKSWQIENNGKTYIFFLKDNVYFSDGTKLTSDQIKYNFIDVAVKKPNKYTIIFKLKKVYSPFLVTVSRPIFKNGFVGVGPYRVQSVNLNGSFVQTINLIAVKNGVKEISYQFYPTEESLKTAFVLGDVTKIAGLKDLSFKNGSLANFPNATVSKELDYSGLVTLFYNTQDKELSDKRLREALSYAVPDSFSNGQRNYGPFVPNTWVTKNGLTSYSQDFKHAQLLLGEAQGASKSGSFNFELKTLPQYIQLANELKDAWKTIGINVTIKPVDALPATFQMFLGQFNVPKDPDQYVLWHSSQVSNIANYKNLRIDKLLEDGRQTLDVDEREKIYADFQKYLLDDPPATFLYFPYAYTVKRK